MLAEALMPVSASGQDDVGSRELEGMCRVEAASAGVIMRERRCFMAALEADKHPKPAPAPAWS